MFYPMFRYGGQHVSYLLSFIGKPVKINRGGPESMVGRLIAVHADYIVLLTKDGIVYVNAAPHQEHHGRQGRAIDRPHQRRAYRLYHGAQLQ